MVKVFELQIHDKVKLHIKLEGFCILRSKNGVVFIL